MTIAADAFATLSMASFQLVRLCGDLQLAMILAVVVVRVMQVILDQVIINYASALHSLWSCGW
jgi:hypothetical protein